MAIVGLSFPVTAAPAQTAAPVRVMTFNIRYGTANDGPNAWALRTDLVQQTIERALPDVVGLQEALAFQIDELTARLSGWGVVGVGRDDGLARGEYAALLYRADRFHIAESGTFWLSDTPDTPGSTSWGNRITRICTWARFVDRGSGSSFYVFNVHLDHESAPSRVRSVELVLSRIRARAYRDPVVIMGDFNAGETAPPMTKLTADGFRNTFRVLHPAVDTVGTFHGFRGGKEGEMIDAIFVSPEWHVDEATIDRWPGAVPFPSDHYPVTAVLRRPR